MLLEEKSEEFFRFVAEPCGQNRYVNDVTLSPSSLALVVQWKIHRWLALTLFGGVPCSQKLFVPPASSYSVASV